MERWVRDGLTSHSPSHVPEVPQHIQGCGDAMAERFSFFDPGWLLYPPTCIPHLPLEKRAPLVTHLFFPCQYASFPVWHLSPDWAWYWVWPSESSQYDFPAELLNQCWLYIVGIADCLCISKCQAHIHVNMDMCIVNYHNNFDHRILEQ